MLIVHHANSDWIIVLGLFVMLHINIFSINNKLSSYYIYQYYYIPVIILNNCENIDTYFLYGKYSQDRNEDKFLYLKIITSKNIQ